MTNYICLHIEKFSENTFNNYERIFRGGFLVRIGEGDRDGDKREGNGGVRLGYVKNNEVE